MTGPDGVGYLPMLKAILHKDTPRFDFKSEDPFDTPRRAGLVVGLLDFHVGFHIDHAKEIRKALGV